MPAPYVGILVDPWIYRGIPKGETGREHLPFYEEGGERYGVTPCFFRPQDIKPGKRLVRAWIKGEKGYRLKMIPLPKVIHNRVIQGRRSGRIIGRLAKEGVHVFNRYNRYGKWTIHRLLARNEEIKHHLPETVLASPAALRKMMEKHGQLLIKPDNGSIGKGIMLLARHGSGWRLDYTIPRGERGWRWRRAEFEQALPRVLTERIKKNRFLVQERIPLATYRGQSFDLRVSVQKNGKGKWQVSGIVAKVAGQRHFLTNVAQGGKTYPLEVILPEIPSISIDKVSEDVKSLALKVAEHLGRFLPHLADLGLDIGITADGFPYFIECNGRDLRITFRNAKMQEAWKETHITPIGYARYLLNRMEP